MSLIGNIVGTLGNFIARIDSRYESSLNAQQFREMRMIQLGSMPVYPSAELETFINAYENNGSVYWIVNLAARKFSQITREVLEEEDKDEADKYKSFLKRGSWQKALRKKRTAYKIAYSPAKSMNGINGLMSLLKRPNPQAGQDMFFFITYISYCICGESFTWLNRGEIEGMSDEQADKQPVLEMYWLPAHLVTIVPDPEDVWGIIGYTIELNGAQVFIRKNDVLFWRKPGLKFDATTRIHLRGLSPLKPGLKALTMDEDSTNAAVAMYQQGGARGVLFEKSLRNITTKQKSDIEEIVAKRINNRDMKSAVANLQGDWGYLDIGKDSVDMQLLDGNDKAFAKLCHVFGVPPGLFLIDQTYENQRSNRKRLVSELTIPDCESFNEEMNRMLLPAFGVKGSKIIPDYAELPEMQEDLVDMIAAYKEAPITLNEFRTEIGFEEMPVKEMDKVLIDSNKIPIEDISEMDQVLNAGPNGQSIGANGVSKVSGNGQGKKLPVGKG